MASIIKVDDVQDASGNNIINEAADTITIGASGDTITIPSGATITNSGTATGFGGITEADQWRLTTSFTGSIDPIASNLERNDDSFDKIGTGMTESSGVFTFPSTGIWQIEFSPSILLNGDDRGWTFYISKTNDNAAWSDLAYATLFVQQTSSNSTYNNGYTAAMFDVTNTTNCKVRFKIVASNASTTTRGDSTNNLTFMSFIRLGDT
jgi:hypothetical protein